MRKKSFFLGLVALIFSFQLAAMSLSEAKSKGLVGENMNGYLGVVVASAEVKKMVAEINAKRKAKYLQLAKKNKITLAQVEKLAAQKTYQKTSAGNLVQKDGRWVKK